MKRSFIIIYNNTPYILRSISNRHSTLYNDHLDFGGINLGIGKGEIVLRGFTLRHFEVYYTIKKKYIFSYKEVESTLKKLLLT